jgi:cyclophilin family peptidyl-prolyl cis-trans isomerase
MARHRTILVAVAALVPAITGAQTPAPDLAAGDARLLTAIVAAEDRRATAASDVATLQAGLESPNAWVRAYATRSFGRLERAEMIPRIARMVGDGDATVRIAAAHALGQAAARAGESEARSAIMARLGSETDANVRGALAETLGRLRAGGVSAADRARAIADIGTAGGTTSAAPPALLRGVARGLFFLSRQRDARAGLPRDVLDRMGYLAILGRVAAAGADSVLADIRMLATAALMATGGANPMSVAVALSDPFPFVRREGVIALTAMDDTLFARPLIRVALGDSAPVVRHRAIAAAVRRLVPGERCSRLTAMVGDPDPSVSLAAIDAMGACAGAAAPSLRTVATAPLTDVAWHAPAHALVALAQAEPDAARAALPRFVASPNAFVRMYAARAAQRLRDTATLRLLARDGQPIVRSASIEGLAQVAGRAGDALYLAALESNDSEVLMAASTALRGAASAQAVPLLRGALARVTALRRETSRDGRVALLARLGELGSTAAASHVRPYLTDFDPVVADTAAAILTRWGIRSVAAPRALPPRPTPTAAQLAGLARQRARITMADGATIELRLFPFDAPTNVARFARLAASRWFDGLTFHRVAPFFVVQGGSPGANEYAGDGPFTRDELGVENRRGTVGLSTRGRDTGDGQIYVNLVPNVQLDHDYTVFAEVVSGLAAFDRMQEGARIRSVRLY